MPLVKSSKPAAFKQNVETEVAAGKPPKQAVAIAYSEARQARGRKAGPHWDSPHMAAHEARKKKD